MFKCSLSGGDSVEGALVAVDPVSKVVVLEQEEDFTLVFPGQCVRVAGDVTKNVKGDELLAMSVKTLAKREQQSCEMSEQNMANINFNVPSDVQAIFDRILFFYPTRWDENKIVVLDQYIIEDPYQAENVSLIAGQDGTADGLNRLTKVLMGERKKLGMM